MFEKNDNDINIKDRSGITTEGLSGTEKFYVVGSREDIRVPFRKIILMYTPNKDFKLPGEKNEPGVYHHCHLR